MKAIHQYFLQHKKVTLTWMWVFFFIALGYMLLHLTVLPQINFWLAFIPGLICLYLRVTYSKAAYDPEKDRFSEQYVPHQQRKKKKK